MSDVYFGIDVGTSQCSIAYVVDGPRVRAERIVRPELVAFRQDALSAAAAERVPSLIGADFTDKRRRHVLFGWDFEAMFAHRRREASEPLRRGRDFFQSVKSDMGTNRVYPFAHPSIGRTPVDITAQMLQELCGLATDGNPDLDPRHGRTVITVPASFSALAREDTLAAAERAGFSRDRIELLDEPIAALVDTVNHPSSDTFLSSEFQHVLMFDYGGGTCDLALMAVRLRAGSPLGMRLETLGISPYRRVGGDDVDRAIMSDVLWPLICSPEERAQLPASVTATVSDTLMIPVARRLKEALCSHIQRKIRRDEAWPDLSRVKEDIKLEARFSVPGLALPQKPYSMTGQQLEAVMQSFVEVPKDFEDPHDAPHSLARPIWETVANADLGVGDLDRVVLNGGSCLNPFVRRMLATTLGAGGGLFSRLQISDAPSVTCSVARGAALACYWKHARGEELVAPIIPHALGVIVQSGRSEQIVASGTRLPFPDPDGVYDVSGRFFVPPNCGPELLVPFFAGYAGSPPEPRHAGTVRVKIPLGTPSGSDVSVKLRIDSDKTLQWWFAIGTNSPEPADSIRDPWTQHVPTIDQRALADHRRKLRQTVDAGDELSTSDLISEANLIRRAGDPEEALSVLEDILERRGQSSALYNVRGLANNELGRSERAVEDYRLAAELDPRNAVARGNYGCVLYQLGRLDEATAAMRLALEMDPTLAYLYHRLAIVSRRQGLEANARQELQQAERGYKAAAERSPLEPDSWRSLADVRTALGDYEGAQKARHLAQDAERFASLGGSLSDVVSGTREIECDEEAR